MKKLFLFLSLFVLPTSYFLLPTCHAADLFDQETPVIDGMKVFEASDTFAEIFEKLDRAKFGGKDIRAALESLETLAPKVKIAVTDSRVVLVRGDDILGTWPRPEPKDWYGFGQIATAILVKMRTGEPALAAHPQSTIVSIAVAAMTYALDTNGRYVAAGRDNSRVLTSAGLEGSRDTRGYWRVTGIIKGSQADIAGINDGDLIVGMNGLDVAQMSDADLNAEFAGFNSGTIKLKVASPSGTKTVVLRRATVVMADADIVFRAQDPERRKTNILEIIVYNISEDAVKIVNEALATYKNTSGIILDLRVARGGDERAAAKLGGLFLGPRPVMRIQENGGEEVEVIPGGASVTGVPVVVLVSNETQGAAEAIAMAFHEERRGALVGTPTAGFARLITKIELSTGGIIELGNRSIKSGRGMKLDGRGVFPLVCLSNIRSQSQQSAFFINVINGDFNAKDFNANARLDAAAARKGCPIIKSGEDEDLLATAVAMKILTDGRLYKGLIAEKN
ncbi:MAG: S41 family peptidase [Alphaproteobacteria bacterium]|nr:S41 family peptidase [Alphaproteobacteria bacterium]